MWNSLFALVRDLPPEVAVVFVAMLPVVELRGAIPLGISLGVHPLEAFILGVGGNLVPVPLILLFMEPVSARLRRVGALRRVIDWVLGRTAARTHRLRSYGLIGLVLFVATPLPSTGAWTGALGASLLGMGKRASFLAIALGTCLAGVVVTALSVLGMISVKTMG